MDHGASGQRQWRDVVQQVRHVGHFQRDFQRAVMLVADHFIDAFTGSSTGQSLILFRVRMSALYNAISVLLSSALKYGQC